MKEVSRQKVIGCLLVGGLLLTVCSGGFMWLFSVAGIYRGTYTREPITNRITDAGTLNLLPVTLVFLVLGVLMMFGAVGYGLWTAKNENRGPRQVVPHFRVLARYGYDENGNYLADDAMIEFAERPRFYVRAVAPGREVLEYNVSEAVWRQCGEGMSGEAELEGKWIGRFTPYVGMPPST